MSRRNWNFKPNAFTEIFAVAQTRKDGWTRNYKILDSLFEIYKLIRCNMHIEKEIKRGDKEGTLNCPLITEKVP